MNCSLGLSNRGHNAVFCFKPESVFITSDSFNEVPNKFLELFAELQELQDMFGDADGVAVLVYDLDFCDGFARFFVH